MDNEIFVKPSSPLKNILVFVLVLVLVVFFSIYFFMTSDKKDVKLKKVTYELGEKLDKDVSKYATGSSLNMYNLDLSRVSVDDSGKLNNVGEYLFYLKKESEIYKEKIIVEDTTPPSVTVNELTVGVNEDYEIADFITSCKDLSGECNIYYEKPSDENIHQKEGTYKFKIIIQDSSENKVKKDVVLHAKKGYSLKRENGKDDTVFKVFPENSNWNNTYTIKFPLALDDHDKKFDETILSLANKDFSKDYEEEIIDKKLITIYNKHNLVIGISVKLEFKNSNIFVTGDINE